MISAADKMADLVLGLDGLIATSAAPSPRSPSLYHPSLYHPSLCSPSLYHPSPKRAGDNTLHIRTRADKSRRVCNNRQSIRTRIRHSHIRSHTRKPLRG
jgi:hypothetical protein